MAANEFRQDPITKQWVIISTGRERRPNQFRRSAVSPQSSRSQPTGASDCPFCLHQMDTPAILQRYGESSQTPWEVCVVPNLYPVLECHGAEVQPPADVGSLQSSGAHGCHEVVIESPIHREFPDELSEQQVYFMLQAYRDRMLAMRAIPGVQYVQVIKNVGPAAGASLAHAHSQIFGLPIVPPRIAEEMTGFHEFDQHHSGCILCNLIERSTEQPSRVVHASEDWVAWCPYASRFGYELWLAPRSHRDRFETLDDNMLFSLAGAMGVIFRKLYQVPQVEAYNLLLHSRPYPQTHSQTPFHWHFEFLPRIAKQAGFEWGTDIFINTIDPAYAARELRAH